MILILILFLQISSKKIRFEDNKIIYEYNDESKTLGEGISGKVFQGECIFPGIC